MYTYIGADESSGHKDWNFKPGPNDSLDIEQNVSSKSDAKKKKKETKSLFASQICVVMIIAVFSDGTIVILWTNEFVNSIHGHVHNRHFYSKETEGMKIYTML